MFCQTCKTKLDEGVIFCRICGRSTAATGPVTFSANPEAVERKLPALIKCNSCSYEGRGEFARSIPAQVIVWCCILFCPIVIPIYFAVTYKYRCPRCRLKVLMIKNKQGQFEQQTGSRRAINILKYFGAGVVLIIILLFITAFVSKYF